MIPEVPEMSQHAPTPDSHAPVPDGVDRLSADVFQTLRRTVHLQRQLMERTLAERGTHPAEALCLRVLAERDGISQRDLADTLHLSRPRVTAILQRLEKAGAVVRRSDEHDQRLTRVSLTDDGRRRAGELHAVLATTISQTIGALPEDDRRALDRIVAELAGHTLRALDRFGSDVTGPTLATEGPPVHAVVAAARRSATAGDAP